MTAPWWMQLLCVMLGGAGGGALRYAVSGWIGRRVGDAFPWGTLTVNASGAFAAGWLIGVAHADTVQSRLLLLCLGAGVLGSYTTVSSLSLQTLLPARDGSVRRAAAYLLLSLATGLCAVFAGHWLATR
ncbi:fluoride efflux transporter FluC [Luteimonas suaedae]|uniref:fluoride efflux transporter FluC n=1 Tax=Luteimonas suaedae TaxID=2605430 RepID=UPI001CA94A03|nr:CrcB family protein [Luteimonas suaedae]